MLGPEWLTSDSTGAVQEALAPFASYLGVGAIFGSNTKRDAGAAVGTERIGEIREALGPLPIPIFAIGGITADIGEVARTGADSAAVVSAVIDAPDMRAATEELLARFR